MPAAPVLRFLGAAAWPLTIWASFAHFDEHPADDYVERTTPIVATAIGFWISVAGLVSMLAFGQRVFEVVSDTEVVRMFMRGPEVAIAVVAVIAPVLYLIGLRLVSMRDERFSH
jgi:hypothetical protein